mgnify:CR=1 FL=1
MSQKLGELLVREKLISADQLRSAIEQQKVSGGRLGANLTKLGYINEEDLLAFLSKQYGVPAIDLKEFEIDPEVLKLVPREVALKHQVIPVNRAGSTLIIATSDPSNIFALDDIKFITNYNIEPVVASEDSIKEALTKCYGESGGSGTAVEVAMDDVMKEFSDEGYEVIGEGDEDTDDLAKGAQEAPVIKLVNLVLVEAIKRNCSDIHAECYEKEFRIRLRLDGELFEFMKPPLKIKNAVISRLKIMADMDIAERRLPQDGRIKIRAAGKEMDFRVSCLPCVYGEKIVLRLLDKSNLQLDMTKLGFEEEQLKLFKDGIYQPYGMVLVTGPTGSGKTTTLYSALSELNKTTANIITAEDPVEYNIEGLNQVQMQEEIGLNFATALRSFLRQDPNVILVGEIRDFETAEIAIKAALTGQLVLSTLHTNDAASSITRLINMGIEPFLVSSSLNIIQAQRLVRKVCQSCKESEDVPVETLVEMGMTQEDAEDTTPYKGRGCSACGNTGYKGRIAIYEILPITEEVRNCIISGMSDLEIKKLAMSKGMKSLRQSALYKMKQGVTTVDEVVAVTMADET